jgi:AhpD family alkylhydroperoxidase
MARIAYIEEDSASAETKSEFERLRGARGSRPGHLYQLLAHSPKLMARWAAFAETLRGFDKDGSVSLDARSRELAIIQVARLTGADYEWSAHAPLARREGVTEEQVKALLAGDTGAFSEADRALLAYAGESTRSVQVSESTFEELRRHFDEQRILELAVTVGFYNCVARVLEGLGIDLEEGRQGIPR